MISSKDDETFNTIFKRSFPGFEYFLHYIFEYIVDRCSNNVWCTTIENIMSKNVFSHNYCSLFIPICISICIEWEFCYLPLEWEKHTSVSSGLVHNVIDVTTMSVQSQKYDVGFHSFLWLIVSNVWRCHFYWETTYLNIPGSAVFFLYTSFSEWVYMLKYICFFLVSKKCF